MSIKTEYDPSDSVDELLALYRTYDWWDNRTREELKKALRHTNELVMLRDENTGDAIAAARILTDYVYYTTVYDVIVSEKHRSNGVGQRLIEALIDHPKLSDTRGFSLLCREGLVPFYQSCGLEIGDRAIEHPDGSPEPLRVMNFQYD